MFNEEVPINEVRVQAIIERQQQVSLIITHDWVFIDNQEELTSLDVTLLIGKCLENSCMLDLLELYLIVELIHREIDLIEELVRHFPSCFINLIFFSLWDKHRFKSFIGNELLEILDLTLIDEDIQLVLIF